MASNERLQKKRGVDEFLNTKLVPMMAKLGNQRHLSSLRDAFALMTPLIIAGAVAVLIITVVFGGWGAGQSSVHGLFAKWSDNPVTNAEGASATSISFYDSRFMGTVVFGKVVAGSLGLISIYLALGLGYFLSRSRKFEHPVMAALVSLGGFVILAGGQASFYGANGVFAAMVAGIVTTEIFVALCKFDKLIITLPDAVPPAVARAFSKMIPVILTALAVASLNAIFIVPTYLTDATSTGQEQFYEKITDADQLATATGFITSGQVDATGLDSVKEGLKVVGGTDLPATAVVPDSAVVGIASGEAWELNASKDQVTAIYRLTNKFYEVDKVVNGGNGWTFADTMFIGLQAPFLKLASDPSANFGLAFLYVLLIGFFWFFGLHGTNIVNGVFIFWLPLVLLSIDHKANGVGDPSMTNADYPAFVGGTFDAYIFLGGTGATLAWIFMTLMLKRRKEEVEVAKFALPSGVFQINEPVTFGVPMVANPIYAIPYIFTMPVLVVSSWLAMDVFHAVPPVIVQIPWTLPVGMGGLFATGFAFQGMLLAVANLLIAMAIWAPFVLLSGRVNRARMLREGKRVPRVRKVTPEERLKYCRIERRKVGLDGTINFLRKRALLIGSALFLGALLIAISATWAKTTAGIAMGSLEGVVIMLVPVFIFYGKFVWHNFMRAIGK